MNKIVVVSDSHGLFKELEDIYTLYKNDANYFLHCGDSEMDENHPLFNVYKAVNGNCDDHSFPDKLLLEVEGKKILLIHGHHHSVKYNLTSLFYYAQENNVDIVCFGHTHYPQVEKYENITIINPGSILANRGIKGRSYAVIEIENDNISVKHYDVVTNKEYKL